MSDIKSAKLAQLGQAGHITEAAREWLLAELVQNDIGQTLSDLWHAYLDAELVPDGSLVDRLFAYFDGLGYSGAMSDRWEQFWAGLSVPPPE